MSSPIFQKGIDLIDAANYRLSDIKPADFAESRRIMTSDQSSFKGPFSFRRSPYMREPLNRFSQDDPARIIVFMGGSQIGKTANLIENAMCWAISESPGPMYYTSGSKDFTTDAVEKRIEGAIDSFNIRNLIRSNSQKKTNKRTGDTSKSKEFAGGWVVFGALGNANELRSRSLMYGFVDEMDANEMADKKEGSFRKLFENRFTQYATKMKLLYTSTPTIKGSSNIESVFLKGDQRHYYIPCPKCGEFIEIQWRQKNAAGEWAGIHFEVDDHGSLIEKSVGYICQSCGCFWTERDKYEILESEVGIWKPHAVASEPGIFSYVAPSLLAPVGAYNWKHYVRDFLGCYPYGLREKPDSASLKVFMNTCLAQTYEERSRAPKINQLTQNTRNYKPGTVPMLLSEEDCNGQIVMLTCACDLNGFETDGRLDYEILAHSETGTTYSVDAGSIGTFQRMGTQENRELFTYHNNEKQNVWDLFYQVLIKKYPTDKGGVMSIHCAGVDTGAFQYFAFTFIEQNFNNPIPYLLCGLKGEKEKVRKVNEDRDSWSKSKENNKLYLLNVNQIKDDISDRMELKWRERSGLSQPSGFMNYPEPTDGKYTVKNYFSHYESEHKVMKLNSDGSEMGHTWVKKHSTSVNHFFDCRVYNLALRDIFADTLCKEAGIKYPDWSKYCEMVKVK